MNAQTTLRRLHPIAAVLATAIILMFWTSTVGALLFASAAGIVTVKQAIAWGLVLLIPALATTGATGFLLGRDSQDSLVLAKQRRMAFIAATGLLVLVPCVLYLVATADADHLGSGAFVTVQTIELVAGGTNILLMTLNARDGLRLTGHLLPPARRG